MARDSSSMNNKGRNQIVGNAGLYYICYVLSRRGWNALITSRNARGIDIIIYNQRGKEMHTIQVKGLSGRNPVNFGSTLDSLIAEYVFIVRAVKIQPDIRSPLNEPEVFIMNSKKVESLITKREKNGKISNWLEVKDYENYKNNWEILKRPQANNK